MQRVSIEEFQENTDEFPALEAYPRKKGGHTDWVDTRFRGRHRGVQQATTREVKRWADTSFRVSSSVTGGKHVSGQLKVPTKRMRTLRAAEAFIQQAGYSKVWNVEDGRIGSWPLLRVQFPVDNTPNEWLLVKTVRPSYLGSVKDGPRSIAQPSTFMEKSATLYSLPERTVKDAIKEGEQRKKGRQDRAVSHTDSPIQNKIAGTASDLLTKDNQRQIHGRTTGWPLVSGGGLKAGAPESSFSRSSSEDDDGDDDLKGRQFEHSTPTTPHFAPILDHPDDDTIKEEDYEVMNTTETGDTIQSSHLVELSDKDRCDVEVCAELGKISMDGVAAAGERQVREKESDDSRASDTPSVVMSLLTKKLNVAKRCALEARMTPKNLFNSEEQDSPASHFLSPSGNIPGPARSTAGAGEATRKRKIDYNEGRDPYEFDGDDSDEDPDYKLPKPSPPKLYRPASKLTNGKSLATPPEVFRQRRDPAVEASWRSAGGVTPDQARQRGSKGDLASISFLVHTLANVKGIDLSNVPLRLPFFQQLVETYGSVPGGARFADFSSPDYVMKKWRDNFCKRKKGEGKVAGVHIFQPPQEDEIECQRCKGTDEASLTDNMVKQFTSDVAKLSDLEADSNEIRCDTCCSSFKTGKLLRLHKRKYHQETVASQRVSVNKEQKTECKFCDRMFLDVARHLREGDCRGQKNNLRECVHCKNMVPKSRYKEHVHGRKSKVTGETTRKGCAEKHAVPVSHEDKEKKLASKARCTECLKWMDERYLPKHMRKYHKRRKADHAFPPSDSTATESPRAPEGNEGRDDAVRKNVYKDQDRTEEARPSVRRQDRWAKVWETVH